MRYTLTLDDQHTPQDQHVIEEGLKTYNLLHAPPDNFTRLNVYLRDEQDEIIGGLLGCTYWGWLYVSHLWIREDMRQNSYGAQMIRMAEQEAVQRGCKNAHLDTMSFQALDFYLKLGYSLFGQLDDLPEGHTRYFLRKTLE